MSNFLFGLLSSLLLQLLIGLSLQYQKKKANEAFKSLIINWVDSLKPKIEKQASNLKTLSKKIGSNNYFELHRTQKVDILISPLLNLELEKYYSTFVVNSVLVNKKDDQAKSLKDLSNEVFLLNSNISLIIELDKKIVSAFEIYEDKITSIIERYNKQHANFRVFLISYSRKMNSGDAKIPDIDLMKKVNDDYIKFNNSNQMANIDELLSTFVLPLKKILSQKNNLIDYQYRYMVNEELNSFSNIAADYKLNTKVFSNDFATLSADINKVFSRLLNTTETLDKNQRLKNFLFMR